MELLRGSRRSAVYQRVRRVDSLPNP